MLILKTIATKIAEALLIILAVMIAIIVIPIILLCWPYFFYKDRQDNKKLRAALERNQKYIVLATTKDTAMLPFITDTLLPRYGQHILHEDIAQADDRQNLSFISKEIYDRVTASCDCCPEEDEIGESDLGVLLMTPADIKVTQYLELIGTDDPHVLYTEQTLEQDIIKTIKSWADDPL